MLRHTCNNYYFAPVLLIAMLVLHTHAQKHLNNEVNLCHWKLLIFLFHIAHWQISKSKNSISLPLVLRELHVGSKSIFTKALIAVNKF